jgi:hypothetical protein
VEETESKKSTLDDTFVLFTFSEEKNEKPKNVCDNNQWRRGGIFNPLQSPSGFDVKPSTGPSWTFYRIEPGNPPPPTIFRACSVFLRSSRVMILKTHLRRRRGRPSTRLPAATTASEKRLRQLLQQLRQLLQQIRQLLQQL